MQTVRTDVASGTAPHRNAESFPISVIPNIRHSQYPRLLLLGTTFTQLDVPDTIKLISGSSHEWAERTKTIVDPYT